MANTTSGTTTFDKTFSIDEIIEEAFERLGIQDVGAYTNATDLPFRFVPCMVSGLAYYLSMKYTPQLTQQMKLLYEDEFQRALQEDGSASSTYITPKAYYPGT